MSPTTISIRQLAGAIGLSPSGDISILRNLIGFHRGQVPPDPTGATVEISLLQHVQRLQWEHFHLNMIHVGADNFSNSTPGSQRDDYYSHVDYAIYRIRNIYAQVSLGVGRVYHFWVLSANAGGLDAPTTEDKLEEITDTWTMPNNGIDVFIPALMNVPSNSGTILGKSAVEGPCEEKDDKGMNGAVVGPWGAEQIARTFAHEVGHYLGLEHRNNEPDNLMCQSGSASSIRNSVLLTSAQGNTAKGHCLVKSGWSP